MSLADQTILVVGGTSGIGLATARQAAAEGARVTVASRSESGLEAAVRSVAGSRSLVLDTLDGSAVDRALKSLGTLDHVVVTASSVSTGAVRDLPIDQAIASMDSKFWGAYRVLKAADVRPGGSFVLVSGFLSRWPQAGSAALSATNAAVEALGRAAALELAPVRVNVVSPGPVATPLWNGMPEDARKAAFDAMAARLPARRVGAADDIGSLICEAMRNPFLTGSVLDIDGGAALTGLGEGRN